MTTSHLPSGRTSASTTRGKAGRLGGQERRPPGGPGRGRRPARAEPGWEDDARQGVVVPLPGDRGAPNRFGRPLSDRRTLGRVGYVHEDPAFPLDLTATGLLRYFRDARAGPAVGPQDAGPALLDRVGLADRAGNRSAGSARGWSSDSAWPRPSSTSPTCSSSTSPPRASTWKAGGSSGGRRRGQVAGPVGPPDLALAGGGGAALRPGGRPRRGPVGLRRRSLDGIGGRGRSEESLVEPLSGGRRVTIRDSIRVTAWIVRDTFRRASKPGSSG